MDNHGFYPTVSQVIPTGDFSIYASMNDGTVRHFDASPLIEEGTVFAALSDIRVFKKTATVLNGTVAWDIKGTRDERDCIDIDPFTIYESQIVKDPLLNAS